MQPRRDGSVSSEEFAWESREFLRKMAIGRVRKSNLVTIEYRRLNLWCPYDSYTWILFFSQAWTAQAICRDMAVLDEALAFGSLGCDYRVLLQKCVFRVDYKIDTIERDFGTVNVERDGTHVDLGMAVVKAGWAKVSSSTTDAVSAHFVHTTSTWAERVCSFDFAQLDFLL